MDGFNFVYFYVFHKGVCLKPKLLYYTQPYYLDSALEILEPLSSVVQIELMIEVTPDSRVSTITDFSITKKIASFSELTPYNYALVYNQLQPYLKFIAKVYVAHFQSNRIFSFRSMRFSIDVFKIIAKQNPDYIHFDSISARLSFFLPFLKPRTLSVTIHDPVMHTGEMSSKRKIFEFIYRQYTTNYFFYSNHATEQFDRAFNKRRVVKHTIQLRPYISYSTFKTTTTTLSHYVLFFGRISYYKGLDLLLEAIPSVLSVFPEQQFIIAGSGTLSHNELLQINRYKKNLILINKYIKTEELVSLISSSCFTICPYRESTQSGVLMTSYAIRKPVVATRVGSFPEYLQDGFQGSLCDSNPQSIAHAIIEMLTDTNYAKLEKNIASSSFEHVVEHNAAIFREVYS